MAKTTLKHLAERLNMSVSTISKALNDSYEISEDTKVMVRQLAQELDYHPNIIAKYLKTGKTNTIGVVIPKMSNPFAAQIIEGIHQAAIANNYTIIITQSGEQEELEKAALLSLVNRGVDGILFCPIDEGSNLSVVQDIHLKIPIVLFDRTNYPLQTFKVGVENAEGIYKACRELFAIGRDRIAVFCGNHQGITKERLLGYKQAHHEQNKLVQDQYIAYCAVDNTQTLKSELKKNIDMLLALPQPPNALIGITDTITTHLSGVLAEMQVAVPQTFALIGFANTELAFAFNPSLSAIVQPAQHIGAIALEKLLTVIQSKHRQHMLWENIKLHTHIELRNSTKVHLREASDRQ